MRTAALCALLVAPLLGAAALAAEPPDMARLSEISSRAGTVVSGNAAHYLEGRPEKALAALRQLHVDGDWETAFVLGNMTWVIHPEASLAWHQQALAWSGGNSASQLEMALQHTRREDCPAAIKAWDHVDAAGELKGHMPVVAAYCHFKLGDYNRAYALLEKAQIRHAGRLEGLLDEIWGARPALVRHAEGVAALRAGGRPDADVLLDATVSLGTQKGERYRGLLAVVDAAGAQPPAGDLADLRCLRSVLADDATMAKHDDGYSPEPPERRLARAKRWKRALDRCSLVLGEGRLPAGKALSGLLLRISLSLDLIDARRALAQHGPALQARAQSEAGDFAALEVLAALQAMSGDRTGLAASDELGWKRYRSARFAASRVIGLLPDTGKPDVAMANAARAAWVDFPEDSQVLWMVLDFGGLEGADRERALRSQVLAEFHGVTAYSELHASKSAARLVKALGEYRALVLPAPAAP